MRESTKSALPLTTPRQVICSGMCYASHNAEADQFFDIPELVRSQPIFFPKAPSAIVGHGAPVVLPDVQAILKRTLERPFGQVTGEAELGIVFRDDVYRVSAKEALDHVLGYTMFNDVTQRDVEVAGFPVSMSKGFYSFGPLGPHVVPREAVADAQGMRFSLRVNGVARQEGTLRDMLYPLEELIARASRIFRFGPGDVLTTGSPPGMFHYALEPGDVIEVEFDALGVLRNPIVGPDGG